MEENVACEVEGEEEDAEGGVDDEDDEEGDEGEDEDEDGVEGVADEENVGDISDTVVDDAL